MKKILFISFLLPFIMFSQHHFITGENEIVWQNTFEGKNINLLATQLKNIEFTNTLKSDSLNITGTSNWQEIKFTNAQPWAKFPFKCFIKVEGKQNKYRVTITNITFDGQEFTLYGVTTKMDYLLNKAALKNCEIKDNEKIFATLNDLDRYFMQIFTVKDVTAADNW